MKDVFESLIPAYYTVISAAVAPIPVFDGQVPTPASEESFILIGNRDANQIDDKDGFTYEVFITIDITIKNRNFGFKQADEIATSILAEINSNVTIDLGNDFQMVSTRLIGSSTLPGLIPNGSVFRKLLRFSHIITQIN